MTLATVAVRNLRHRPARTAFAVAGVAVAFAAFVVVQGVSDGIERSWVDGLRQQGTDMLAVQRHTVNVLTATIDTALGAGLASVPGVTSVAGELVDLIELETGEILLVSGWEEGSHLWRSQPVLRGRVPWPGEPEGAAIGLSVAEVLRKDVGDAIVLGGHPFRITGILGDAAAQSPRVVIVPLTALQALLGKPGVITVFSLRLAHPHDPAAVAEVRARLSERFPSLAFSATDEVADADTVLRLLRAFAWSTSAVALVVALVLMTNTLLMSVMERTREIGVLSAVGWTRGRIAALLVFEGLILTTIGSVVGTGLGLAGLEWLARLPRVAGALITDVTAMVVVQMSATALLLGVLSSWYPAWRGARMSAVESLRSE